MPSQEPILRESFLLRVRWKPGQTSHEVWIQHVRSGEAAVVHDLDQAVAFIDRWAPLCLSGTGQAESAEKKQQGLR